MSARNGPKEQINRRLLSEHLATLDWTQKDLADAANVSLRTISKAVARPIKRETAFRIDHALQTWFPRLAPTHNYTSIRPPSDAFAMLCPLQNGPAIIVKPSQPGVCAIPNTPTTDEDANAIRVLSTALAIHKFPFIVKLHNEVTPKERGSNLFLLCGIVGNSVARAVQEHFERVKTRLPYRFTKWRTWWQIEDRDNQVWRVPVSKAKTRDYAILGAIKNPWSPAAAPTRLYFAAGINGVGTWAAAAALAEPADLIQDVQNRHVDPYAGFVCVLEVRCASYSDPKAKLVAVESFNL